MTMNDCRKYFGAKALFSHHHANVDGEAGGKLVVHMHAWKAELIAAA